MKIKSDIDDGNIVEIRNINFIFIDLNSNRFVQLSIIKIFLLFSVVIKR